MDDGDAEPPDEPDHTPVKVPPTGRGASGAADVLADRGVHASNERVAHVRAHSVDPKTGRHRHPSIPYGHS